MNQTVKANLKTFTLGLNEDCQRFGNAKLYTISSNGVGLGIPSSPSNEKAPMVTPMNQGNSERRFQLKGEKCNWFMIGLCTDLSVPVCNPVKMEFPPRNICASPRSASGTHTPGCNSQLCQLQAVWPRVN